MIARKLLMPMSAEHREEFVDPYIDQKTGVLGNLVGASTWDELRQAEGELVGVRILEIIADPPSVRDGSLAELQEIHRRLFQDVYAWAGMIRTVEIRKNTEGSAFFLPSQNISMGLAWAQGELAHDHMLRSMSKPEFAHRLAYHYDNYNFVHPFREGNGRTQRMLWTLLCHDAGYDLDWRQVSGEENDEASRLAAENRDFAPLEQMFNRITVPCDDTKSINADFVTTGHLR